jgi:4-hydroxy-tetrahydrodipicolinate synthase
MQKCVGSAIIPKPSGATEFSLALPMSRESPLPPKALLPPVLAPVLTPFDDELRADSARFIRLCRWLVEAGVGLAVFGTTSEANSLATPEKITLLDALAAAGMPLERIVPGTGCCAFPDTVALTRSAIEHGCAGVLMLPPFYYKNVSDDGLFASYAEVIERVGDARLRIYLYHIPPVAQIPLGVALIERLLQRYPTTIAGIKDSGGDFDFTRRLIETFAPRGFDVYAGSETFLLPTLVAGGAGCISATANVNPAAMLRLARDWRAPDAAAQQAALDAVRQTFQKFPIVPALKAAVAQGTGDDGWRSTRPPLVPLDSTQRAALFGALPKSFALPSL